MDLSNKKVKLSLGLLVGLIIAIIIFRAGMSVGYHKALFSHHLGDNYLNTFRGGPHPRGGWSGSMRDDFTGGHSSIGQIVKVSLPTITIEDLDSVEKNIIVDQNTKIRRFRDDVPVAALTIGTKVIVLGDPNDNGQIQARLIRILPDSNQLPATTSPIH